MTATPKLTGQERRIAIVDAAIKLFSEKGFRGATTRELAAAVGVSEPVLYQHFATKGDLYAAIIDAKSHGLEAVLAELESYLHQDDDAGFFGHLARLILRFHDEDPAYMRLLLFSALERHELSDLFHERQSCTFEQAVVSYIQRRMEQGAFRSLDPRFVAQTFFGMVAHHGLHSILHPNKGTPLSREEVVTGMVAIFLKGIENER